MIMELCSTDMLYHALDTHTILVISLDLLITGITFIPYDCIRETVILQDQLFFLSFCNLYYLFAATAHLHFCFIHCIFVCFNGVLCYVYYMYFLLFLGEAEATFPLRWTIKQFYSIL